MDISEADIHDADIDDLLRDHGGACSRDDLLRIASRHRLDNEVRRGRLVAVYPRAYVRPWDVEAPAVREAAAIACVGTRAMLSHTTALRRHGLQLPPHATERTGVARALQPVHVTTVADRHPRGTCGLVVHRTRRPARVQVRDGLPTQRIEDALFACWRLASVEARRAPVIAAVGQRLTTPSRLADAAAGAPREARHLVGLLAAGCRSELEIWGYLNVFDADGLRDAIRQRPVHVGGRRYYLDLAYEAERVAVELDGRAYHASPAQWERDIARDVALATIDWQTVRFSHRRLVHDAAGCRRDVLAIRAARRRRVA